MRRIYRNFPSYKTAQVFKMRFPESLKTFVKRLYEIEGYRDRVQTYSTGLRAGPVEVERVFRVHIAEHGDFVPLPDMGDLVSDIPDAGKMDFRIKIDYLLETHDYEVPMYTDEFLIRADKANDVLTLYIHHVRGLQRTATAEILSFLEG